jgi:2-polyprenyl-3-methyl-5-hydroxy-6-metoxy-1,4-benzoquinol methylase
MRKGEGDMISENYRQQNQTLHETKPGYGTGGARWADLLSDTCENWNTRDVLDYGCGKGRLAAALPFPINQYDPAIPAHCMAPEPADIVICTDVLEHIEPEYVDDVLDHIQHLTRKVAILNVSTRKAHKTLPDGRNTHLTVHPKDWWLPKIKERFASTQIIQENAAEFTVIVGLPKKIVATR